DVKIGSHEHCIAADLYIILDRCLVFLFPVVIAGDRPGAYVDVIADRGIAEISQMHRFGVPPQSRFLHFNEVPDSRSLFQASAHTQMSEWADGRLIGKRRI